MTLLQSRKFVLKVLAKGAATFNMLEDFELLEFHVVSSPVTARTRKLRAVWTAEGDQELRVHVDASARELLAHVLSNPV
jgi:hypothetical protein